MVLVRSRLKTTLVYAAGFVVAIAVNPAAAQTTPPAAPPAPQAAAAPAPLPSGARIAFVNLQVVFNESELGKQGQERWRALTQKLFANLAAREKEILGLSEKIKTQQSLIDESALRAWNRDLARLQREAQFAQQEAQVQSEQVQQELLAEFEKKVQPVLDSLRVEKGLHAILGVQGEPGGLTFLSGEAGIDLSAELVKRLNAMK